jgi:DNA-binding winged helix-turn-helix (wHTH) protein
MTIFRFHPFEFDATSGLVYQGDEETLLPPKAAHVLQLLVESAGQLASKDELLETVWENAYVTESSLTDAISLLRRVLGDDTRDPTYIQTLHRRGYRFIARNLRPLET